MPNILIEPKRGREGLILFSHRDYPFLRTYSWVLKRWKEKKNYQLAVHVGWFHERIDFPSCVDFALASESTLLESNVDIIRVCSRDFINPNIHKYKESPKIWDFINMSGYHPNKRLLEYLKDVKSCLADHKFALILQVPSKKLKGKKKTYLSQVLTEASELSKNENFDFIPVHLGNNVVGMDRSTAFKFLALGRCLTHYTTVEGESRIISEALKLNMAVVAREALVGGGLDELNTSNSVLWNDKDDKKEIFKKALSLSPSHSDSRSKLKYDELINELGYRLNIDLATVKKVLVSMNLDFILPLQQESPFNMDNSISFKNNILNFI